MFLFKIKWAPVDSKNSKSMLITYEDFRSPLSICSPFWSLTWLNENYLCAGSWQVYISNRCN